MAEAVAAVLDRAEAVAGLGAAKSKADRRVLSEAWDLHWTALISARNAMQGEIQSSILARDSLHLPMVHSRLHKTHTGLRLMKTQFHQNLQSNYRLVKDESSADAQLC